MVPKRLVTDLLSTLQESVSALPKEFLNQQKVSHHTCNSCSQTKQVFFLTPTYEDELKQIVTTLPAKASSGHDNISNILLKEIINPLAHVLVEIFNKSMTTGEFPNIMKLAEVVPLYKNKEHYLESNYRPISLLTTISKILEKIMYQRVYSFLQNTGQIYSNQYGFRANHSCEHAVGQAVSSICQGLGKSPLCGMHAIRPLQGLRYDRPIKSC